MDEKPAVTRETVSQGRGSLILQFFRGFVSMRTGIFILLLVMAAAFIGTFIPPGREHKFLGDVYHTWCFRLLLGLLCVNILACSARRLPALWRSTTMPQASSSVKLDSLPHYQELKIESSVESVVITAATLLTQRGFRVQTDKDGAGPLLYADRGRWAPWGTLAVHLSILVITAGALYGNFYGFDRDIALPVGSSVEITGSQYPGVAQPFSLKLNTFTTQYYDDGSVSDWVSNITVEQNGTKVLSQEVKVNQPLDYNGIMVYQFSYGTTISTQVTDAQGHLIKEADVAERGGVESQGFVIRPVRFVPDFNPAQPMASASSELRNPHVLYIIYRDGREVDWGAAKLGEEIPLSKNKGHVTFTAAQPFSGLQIKHDPGVPVVWFGFILMTVGFFISLYTKRLRIWLTVAPGQGAVIVQAGGRGNRNLFDQVVEELNNQLVSDTASRRKI
ncbi:MAG: cytochrome c biogenesis protein ResB [Negativicutes bacterium]|nr:cytochrome c biogenesis protein ResB [Negativicutes bacterium]